MLFAAMALAVLTAAGAAASGSEELYTESQSIYQEQPATEQSAPPALANGEWLPACSPRIVIAAVFKQDHKIHVVGYVKRSLIGRTLKLQSRLAGGKTVLKFKPRKNGYFNVTTKRPRHKVARSAAWRVAYKGFKTPYVKLYRPLVLNNVHQRKGLLMVNGQLNVAARDDTVIAVERMDNCRTASRIGQVSLPMDGSGVLDGRVPLRDLVKPVATFVRLKVRVRQMGTGGWGKSYWSLVLPVVLRP